MIARSSGALGALGIGIVFLLSSSCSDSEDETSEAGATDTSARATCSALTGTAWTPEVEGVASSNHDPEVTVTTEAYSATGAVTGLAQAAGADREISVTIPMTEDLGESGSLTLIAETENFPANLEGGAFPVLVSLSDGTNEFINLTRAGTGDDCAAAGYFTCTADGLCSRNSGCTISSPSAYASRTDWQQHQIATFGFASVNTFPTCNWTAGDPGCAFNSTFFVDGKLRSGVNYTAKYVLLTESYSMVNGYSSGLKVTAIKKKDSTVLGGAVDLNLILVGATNVQASRTDKGKQNLNVLLKAVSDHFNQANVGVKLGTVNVLEYGCEQGGDAYAELDLNDVDDMLAASSSLVSADTAGKALNIYLVSSITQDSSNLTILGISGGIGGPPVHGTGSSGLVFSSFDMLDTYNAGCTPGSDCPVTSQDSDFIEMGTTIAHEMGHYLGLNHLSESDGATHDPLPDSPICTKTQRVSGSSYITISACLSDTNVYSTGRTCSEACTSYNGSTAFCPEALECQFNYIMWWTTKNYNVATGDGDANIFSGDSSTVLNYSPFIR